jgi:hypothetical protein
MTRGHFQVLALALFLLCMVLLGLWLRGDEAASPDLAAGHEHLPTPASGSAMSIVLPETAAAPALPAQDSVLLAVAESKADATQTMSHAREHGDARQPALQRDAVRDMPTAAELADPDAYQRYEARQSQRLKKAYVKAADAEIPRLQKDIEQAQQAGMSPEQIAEGEEKLRRIQAMRDQLQANTASEP